MTESLRVTDAVAYERGLPKLAFATPSPLMMHKGRVYIPQLEAQGHEVQLEAWRRHRLGGTIRVSPTLYAGLSPGPEWAPGDELDGIDFIASFDANMTRSDFWTGGARHWLRDVNDALSACQLLLASAVGDPWLPLPHLALRKARQLGFPSVVLYDSDRPAAIMESARGLSTMRKSLRLTFRLQSVLDRIALKGSDLALIKVGDALETLGATARAVHPELHTMYRQQQVLPPRRDVSGGQGTAPRLVYAGRVIALKQIDKAIEFCKDIGHDASLTIVGEGDDMERLKRMAASLDVKVDFVPYIEFGDGFLRFLAAFDYQLFLSDFPETPRSIVDGFAAGLPAVVARTGYTKWLRAHSAPVLFVEDGLTWERLREGRSGYAAQATKFARAHSIEAWMEERAACISGLLCSGGPVPGSARGSVRH